MSINVVQTFVKVAIIFSFVFLGKDIQINVLRFESVFSQLNFISFLFLKKQAISTTEKQNCKGQKTRATFSSENDI